MYLRLLSMALLAASATCIYQYYLVNSYNLNKFATNYLDVRLTEAYNSRADTPSGEFPDLDLLLANWTAENAQLTKIEITEPQIPFQVQFSRVSDSTLGTSLSPLPELSPFETIAHVPRCSASGRHPGFTMIRLVTHDKGSEAQAGQRVPVRAVVHYRIADAREQVASIELIVRRGSHDEYEF